jgi:hypothetical protein
VTLHRGQARGPAARKPRIAVNHLISHGKYPKNPPWVGRAAAAVLAASRTIG